MAAALVLIGIGWILVTGLIARSHLQDVRSDIKALRAAITSGDTHRAHQLAARIQDAAHRAHELTSGPAWWVASNIPVLGSPLHTSRVITTEADTLGHAVLPGVLRLADDIEAMPSTANSRIDLAPLVRADPVLREAARTAHRASSDVAGTSGSWLGPVSSARNSLASQLSKLDGELTGASRAVRLLLPMLGRDGPQRYFIGFLNEAESRGGGGIPGAFAIATADNGRITFDHFGSDTELAGVRADVDLGADFDARYAQNDPTGVIQNSNLSPDFSYAGRIWAGMWKAKSGQRIDGAIAIDPTALSYLLKVTGPATLADGSRVSANNVVALTQKTQYEKFPGNSRHDKNERKDYLITVAKAVSARLTRGGDVQHLVKAMSRAAGERRITVWSAHGAIESQLRLADWAGELGNPYGAPFSGFVVNNAAGSKLDYYLDRSVTYRRTDCGTRSDATATIKLTNTAPRRGLPPYVTVRGDHEPKGAKPGDNKLIVTYYAGKDAHVSAVRLDGKSLTVASLPEGDTLATSFTVELPAGAARTITVTVSEPPSYGRGVQILRQPLVRPITVNAKAACR